MWISYAVSDREVETDVQNPAVRTVQKRSDQLLRLPRSLEYIDDLIIDDCKGCIEALVVPEGGKWCNFWRWNRVYHTISCIKRIGPDLILVEIHRKNNKIGRKCV